MNRIHIILTLVMMLGTGSLFAQQAAEDGTVVVQSLFRYPEAPAYMDDLNARSDYLMDNFWKDMDFKQKIVNQAALQHAFEVYSAPMRWASIAKVENSVKDLLKKLSKNPSLAVQFMKAAEETFHSPRSAVYIDDVYTMFLEGFLANKKVKDSRKAKYAAQLAAMRATAPGQKVPAVELTDTAGNAVTPRLGEEFTIYIFGPSANTSMRQVLLKLNTNMPLERLCSDNRLAINYFNTSERTDEGNQVLSLLPEFVTGGYADKALAEFDIRLLPSVYLLDADGVILARNITLGQAFDEIAGRKFTPASN